MWMNIHNLRDKSDVMINTDLIWKIEVLRHSSSYKLYLYRSMGESATPFDISEEDYIKICDKLGLDPFLLDR